MPAGACRIGGIRIPVVGWLAPVLRDDVFIDQATDDFFHYDS
jgi:hypothetical protein